jgi:integrase
LKAILKSADEPFTVFAYATFRLREGTHHFHLAQNMGTSVKMLEEYYGHVRSRDVAEELTKMSGQSKRTRR